MCKHVETLAIFIHMCYNEGMVAIPDFSAIEACIRERRGRFDAFYALLKEYNARFNLTSIIEEEEVYVKHFCDSLAGMQLFAQGMHVAEVGSGAGFPSIPLMLAREDLRFTLIESTNKKCTFLETAVREFGLNASVVCGRAEDIARTPAREHFDAVCARAVARLDTLAEYCMPLVKRGGFFVAYKGASEQEIGMRAVQLLGGGETEEIAYELPRTMGTRTLFVAKKVRPTPPKYPRGHGAERKAPL